MKKWIKRIILIFVFLLILIFGSLYLIQDRIIFHPDKIYKSPDEIQMPEFKEVIYPKKDSSNGFGWYFKGDKEKPAILYCHGNKAQVAFFAPLLKPYLEMGYPVLMVEYQGFGFLPGHPSEKALIEDATAGFDFLKDQGHSKVILHGFSLGTGVVLGVAEKRSANGVILEAPFFSLYRLADEKSIPFAQFLLKNPFLSNKRIVNIEVPLLIIHGIEDKVIPFEHGQDLYQLAKGKDKTFISLSNASHNVFEFGSYEKIKNWLKAHFK